MTEENSRKKILPASNNGDVETWITLSSMAAEAQVEERGTFANLRPSGFADYVGQARVKDAVLIACHAASRRNEALDHLLLHGPPGLGKTSLARLVAEELQVGFKATSGPVIERPGDLAAILTALNSQDVLFIDEIHRLPRVVEEVLYPAMEDFEIDIMIGQGHAAKSVKLDLKPFTLLGATTRTGLLTSPLRDRFGMVLRLDFYQAAELQVIVQRSAGILGVEVEDRAALELAERSRGTPRVANRLLKRVRDYAQEKGDGIITCEITKQALEFLHIDCCGLDSMDREILITIIDKFEGGPVGIETISAAIGEERETLEDVYEPYLVQQGFIARTRRGREATQAAYTHLGKSSTETKQANLDLFSDGST